jgi:hypothetical protein
VTPSGTLERIEAALAAASEDRPALALGWATVELDRAAAELAAELGTVAAAFVPAADSVVLGARCRVAYGVLSGGRPLAILEPRTEGRLAGRLARLGEGPAAIWSRAAEARLGRRQPASAQPGPFGPERLLSGGPLQGPFSLLIEGEPGTIDG